MNDAEGRAMLEELAAALPDLRPVLHETVRVQFLDGEVDVFYHSGGSQLARVFMFSIYYLPSANNIDEVSELVRMPGATVLELMVRVIAYAERAMKAREHNVGAYGSRMGP